MKLIIPVFLALILVSCRNATIVPIDYGHDQCSYCSMMMIDPHYGAELLTHKGKAYKFDSVECLAAYYQSRINQKDVKSLWVVNFRKSKSFIDASKAVYLHSLKLKSPMGLNLTAFQNREQIKVHDPILSWKAVQKLVYQKWLKGKIKHQ